MPDSSMKQALTLLYLTAVFIKTVVVFLTFFDFLTPPIEINSGLSRRPALRVDH